MVASALSGMSGKTWSNTSPWLAPVPELAADRLGASAGVFVSVRRAAGEEEPAIGWDASFAGGFAAAVFSESLVAADELGFAPRETSALVRGASGPGAVARDAALVEAEEVSARRPRILGSAMMETTTKTATPSGTM